MNTLGEICRHLLVLAGTSGSGRPAAPAGTAAVEASAVESAMLDIVSRVTGYPVDMLDLDMDIGNDLGIDSIKRVEILSVFEEEHPDMPSAAPEDLAEMNTLGEICRHLLALAGGGSTPAEADSAAIPSVAEAPVSYEQIPRRTVKLVEAALDHPEAVDLSPDRIIYVIGNDRKMAEAITAELALRGLAAEYRENFSAETDFADAAGLVLVPEMPEAAEGLWPAEDITYIKNAFEMAVQAGRHLTAGAGSGKTAVLAVVLRMDGVLGFGAGKGFNPLQGAFSGLVKTAAIEWEKVACHVIDVDPTWQAPAAAATTLVDNILNAAGPVEVALNADSRKIIALESSSYPEGEINLVPEDVVVVSGGARGVTARCALQLARKSGSALVLLGRSPLPEKEPDWLAGLTAEAEIKTAIRDHAFGGQKVTPVEIEAAFQKYMAGREIAANLAAMQAAAREVAYYSVDIRDADAVGRILHTVRESLGEIRCILHGAGVLEDRFIVDKTREQFDKVFDTKALGAQSLLAAVSPEALRYLVFFSSVSARMGNQGQVDYAMANEVLNKIAQKLRREWPGCRVVAVNWGPWDGGMVTPSLKREFAKNNISLIPLDAGADCLLSEMAAPAGADAEVVIGAGFADMAGEGVIEDAAKKSVEPGLSSVSGPAAEKGSAFFPAFDREISVAALPILSDHVLKGVPVVPFALAAEWLGNAALHSNPGLVLAGLEDMRLLAGLKADENHNVCLLAGKARKEGAVFAVDVQIRDAVETGSETLYYSARAMLGNDLASPPDYQIPAALAKAPAYSRKIADVYNDILFHGKTLQGIKEIVACCPEGLLASAAAAPTPDKWIANPMRKRWLTDPLVLDVAFQLAIVWCYENAGQVSLPVSFAQYRQYREAFPAEGVRVVLEVTGSGNHKMTGDFTFLDADSRVVARMTGYQAIMDKSLAASF